MKTKKRCLEQMELTGIGFAFKRKIVAIERDDCVPKLNKLPTLDLEPLVVPYDINHFLHRVPISLLAIAREGMRFLAKRLEIRLPLTNRLEDASSLGLSNFKEILSKNI